MKILILIAQLAAADVPCTVPVPENTGEWKQISASSVTFCVPATWRVRGTRASYSGGAGSANSTPLRTERLPETIGGRQAEVWRQMGVGRLQTGVSFAQAPLFSILGEAAGDEQVTVQLAVFRTVRFASPGP
jgi:hypothetical protein